MRSVLIQMTSVHDQVADNLVEVIALILLPLAVLMCAYALTVFVWRSRAIAKKTVRNPSLGRKCAGSWTLGVVFTAMRGWATWAAGKE